MRHTQAAASVLVAALASGCTPTVDLALEDAQPGSERACAELVSALPAELVGLAQRDTSGGPTAAWGDPPITLRCGVARPASMDAGVLCTEVNGVGWWEQPGVGGTIWTTVGRLAYVEVAIPQVYGNPVNVLAELSAPVDQHIAIQTPCAPS